MVITAGTHYMTGEDIRRNRRRLWSVEPVHGFSVIKTYAPRGYRRSTTTRVLNYVSYAAIALIAGMRQGKVDAVLMATDPMFIVPVGIILSKLRRAVLLIDERDLFPDTAVALGYLTSPTLTRAIESWFGHVRRKSRSILAATPGIKRALVNQGIDAGKVFVLPNVRSTSFGPMVFMEDAVRAKHGWDSKFLALYAGSMGQANDVWTILKAAQLLNGKCSDAHFVFIGDGEKKKDYLAYCSTTNLKNVSFLGALPWSETCGYLATANVTVSAAFNNPFWQCVLATKTLDSFLAGKAVVYAGSGDTADLIAAACAGRVVRSEDSAALAAALQSLAEQPETTRAMGAAARTYAASHFSRERLLETMRQALDKI